MSFAVTFLIVSGAVIVYYASMIAYDLYAAKMATAESEEAKEIPIDISGQLEGFESREINSIDTDEEFVKKKSFVSFLCMGLSADKMNNLMEDAASGTPNAELKNILFKCNQAIYSQQ